jgi:hypothetical protein
MIGFCYKRKGLQKLFENGKFEIEKEKKECPLLSFRLLSVWAAIS